ncbi:hypothetical protein [Dysgonomonas sp. PH5-37]|uniref:hypothetical protein n=2 Tax=unclassified Dysgonomonas TaxID=2630389 RepID=UPI002474AEA7|nr:hypothetical protein [Dysgonomonas sp. PH5-37]
MLIAVFGFTFGLRAQVTIGSDIAPSKAALLDIKEKNSDSGGETATSGGVLLPRVNLVAINSLEPFISGGGSATEKATHKGLVVYNLTNNSTFDPGIYYWDGTQWNTSSGFDVTANNGLTKTGDNIQLGGTLTKPTNITLSNNHLTYSLDGTGRIGVGTTTPNASAVLDMVSTDKGILIPRVSLSSGAGVAYPVSNPATGLLVFNTINAGSGVNVVKANNFYFWNGSRWSPIMQTEVIQEEISKLRIPQPALFRLENDVAGFLNGIGTGSSKTVPMSMVFNSIPTHLSYNSSTRTVTFRPGSYMITFVYEGAIPITSNVCNLSSYFVDFPKGARIHSTASHKQGSLSNHGGTISYTFQTSTSLSWIIRLGRGQSGNCTEGLKLVGKSTFVSILRFGD